MNTERVIFLLSKYQKHQLTQGEAEELKILIESDPEGTVIKDALAAMMEDAEPAVEFDTERWKRLASGILEIDKQVVTEENADIPVHRVHFLRTAWFRYAAILLLIAGAATFLLLYAPGNSYDPGTAEQRITIPNDIEPGTEKAILTLADGTTIALDSMGNGSIASQGNVQVIKLDNGKIAYDSKGSGSDEVMWNTMATPRGGQYVLVLPDGTRVWLNAASSITYPAAFVGRERAVKVSGEAYFEVTKNTEKPFVVDVDGKSTVRVLGTSFNINAYRDEPMLRTTLVEGKVNITSEVSKTSAVLLPGQKAEIMNNASEQTGIAVSEADVKRALAWKNGLFHFNNADLKTVARQLEKWYNIDVTFEGEMPDVQLIGEMKRGVKLSTIIKWFNDLGIKTRLEDRNLIIL